MTANNMANDKKKLIHSLIFQLEESIETSEKKSKEFGKKMASMKEQIKEGTTINGDQVHQASVGHFVAMQKRKSIL
jgi:hypothetical protein